MNKATFKLRLEKKIPARWHMTLICLLTVASGILFSKGVLHFELARPMLRYGSAVLVSYAVFFLLVYIWLKLHFPRRTHHSPDAAIDAMDLVDFGRLAHSPARGWKGQGGEFSGAGSSGSWDPTSIPAAPREGESAGSKGLSALGDLDEGIVIVLLIALVAAVFGAAGYVIYQAPDILFEAAFEVALSAGLFRRAKKMASEGWTYSIFKWTWLPFAIVLCFALVFGYVIKHQCPEANSFAQYRALCWD